MTAGWTPWRAENLCGNPGIQAPWTCWCGAQDWLPPSFMDSTGSMFNCHFSVSWRDHPVIKSWLEHPPFINDCPFETSMYRTCPISMLRRELTFPSASPLRRISLGICFENPSSSNGPQRLPRRMPKARRGKQARAAARDPQDGSIEASWNMSMKWTWME